MSKNIDNFWKFTQASMKDFGSDYSKNLNSTWVCAMALVILLCVELLTEVQQK